ncbi:MAG: hypothetical protein ACM3Q2_01700, partial [Syntrophothermus sp.]
AATHLPLPSSVRSIVADLSVSRLNSFPPTINQSGYFSFAKYTWNIIFNINLNLSTIFDK